MATRTQQWGLTVLGATLYFAFTYAWNSLAALIPLVARSLGLSEFETGIVLGTLALTLFSTWPVVSPWVERIGPARSMGVGVVVLGAAGIGRAGVHSFWGLVLAMVVLSIGGSTVTYGLPSVVASWFPVDESGAPLGIVTVDATLGTVASFDTMPAVAALMGGWRPALVVSGIPAVAAGGLWLVVGGIGPHRDGDSTSPSLGRVVELLKRPAVFTLVLAGTMYLFATHSIYGWLSPLLIDRGLTTGDATQLVAVVTSGMIIGGLGIPALADRTARHALFVAGGGAVFSLCTGALAVLAPRFLSLACVGLVMGIAIGGVSPLLRQFPLDMVPSGSVSTVIGMIFGIGALGGFLGPVLVGTARAWTGTTLLGFAIIALPGTALVGVALRLSRG